MSKSEAVVIESIEVRELLRFLFYLDILNKLSVLQRKHSKYMYAKCLNFPCFITYLAACMHACILHVLSVCLTRVVPENRRRKQLICRKVVRVARSFEKKMKMSCPNFWAKNKSFTKMSHSGIVGQLCSESKPTALF